MDPRKYNFAGNDPFDHDSLINLVVPPLKSSIDFMQSIREYNVKKNSLVIWTLGQNGFILKSSDGTTICIDPYLSNYCAEAEKYRHFNIRLDEPLLDKYLNAPEAIESKKYKRMHPKFKIFALRALSHISYLCQ